MTKEDVLKSYEPVIQTDDTMSPCTQCDAADECLYITGDNPYFRVCHDYGFLMKKEPTK